MCCPLSHTFAPTITWALKYYYYYSHLTGKLVSNWLEVRGPTDRKEGSWYTPHCPATPQASHQKVVQKLQTRREAEVPLLFITLPFLRPITAQEGSKGGDRKSCHTGFEWQSKASTHTPMHHPPEPLEHSRGQPRTHLSGLPRWHDWWIPQSAPYIFIRSPGLACDTEVIKCSGAIRAALSALKQRQRGCQTHLRQLQKHLIPEGASWELLYNWVPSTHYQLGESRKSRRQEGKKSKQAFLPSIQNSLLQRGIWMVGKGRKKCNSSKRECVRMLQNFLLSLVFPFHGVSKKDPPLLHMSPESLHPNFAHPEPQQPDALGGHPDPLSPKHTHSNPGWGCLEVNIHSTLIRNIWPLKRVDTEQAGSCGFVVGTQSYRGRIKNTIGKHQLVQGILHTLLCGSGMPKLNCLGLSDFNAQSGYREAKLSQQGNAAWAQLSCIPQCLATTSTFNICSRCSSSLKGTAFAFFPCDLQVRLNKRRKTYVCMYIIHVHIHT